MTEDTQRTAWRAKLVAKDQEHQADPHMRQLIDPRNRAWGVEWMPSAWADHLWRSVSIRNVSAPVGTITLTAMPNDGDSLTIDGVRYAFRVTATHAPNPSQPSAIPITFQWVDDSPMPDPTRFDPPKG